MLPRKHFLVTFFICIPLFLVYQWWVLLILASAVLIDVDHYIHYVFKFKKFNLKKAYNYYLNRDNNKKREKLLFVFHTWEVLSIILILGFFFQIFWLIFLGFFIHVLEDIYDYYTRVKIYSRRISLFFDM
ncbi:hypothetical protein J4414_01510 [Candidatus Woesearchaeota archaeon]|nr:hypothetical protein [Candidatus Woesearchaeota archaeon]